MKQLISRIDSELHRRLKMRAAREGRSVNDLVIEVLERAVADEAESFRRALDRSGLRVIPPRPSRPPSRDAVVRANRGAGTPLSDALDEERAAR